MKKVFLIGAVALVALSSCKKIRTCCCDLSSVGLGEICVDSEEKMTKKDAKADCEDGSDGLCKLK